MADVNDSSIMSMAQGIVSDFVDGKATLNEGVQKKASEYGLNVDQTQRLIERANTEAFLRKFPETTEFEVASPEEILGIKTASSIKKEASAASDEGLFKAASVKSEKTLSEKNNWSASYSEKIASISGEDIFGMNDDEFIKEASVSLPSAIDVEAREMSKAWANMTKEAAQIVRENNEREIAFQERAEELAQYIKQASISGAQSIADSEAELLNAFPENTEFTRKLYNCIVEKMASEHIAPNMLERAAALTEVKLASSSTLTEKYQHVLDVIA